MNKKSVTDVDVTGKRVLVRCDFNVPMKDGKITDENRIMGALPTIKYLMEHNAKVVLCSHMGKPHNIFDEKVKLNKKEKKAVEALPAEIESMEAELNRLVGLMSTPDYHSREPAQLRADAERCQALQSTIEAGYARWSELEKKSTQASLGVD